MQSCLNPRVSRSNNKYISTIPGTKNQKSKLAGSLRRIKHAVRGTCRVQHSPAFPRQLVGDCWSFLPLSKATFVTKTNNANISTLLLKSPIETPNNIQNNLPK